MKIKMTIIAFFVSVLMLSSCMKNEVSPGIEEIRSAYASLITAKAEYKSLMGKAEALILEATADKMNLDNLYLAQENALKLDSLAAEMQLSIDSMNKIMQDEKDSIVATYFENYKTALGNYHTTLTLLAAKLRSKIIIETDFARSIDFAKSLLIDAEADLVFVQAELDLAIASLGDQDALKERIRVLTNDTLALRSQVYLKNAEKEEVLLGNEDPGDEPKEDDYVCTEVGTAQTAYDNALDDFLNGRTPDPNDILFEKPDFWITALDSVNKAEAELSTAYGDTLDAYLAWKEAYDILEIGFDSITDAIADLNELIDLTNDSLENGDTRQALDVLISDTLTTSTAYSDALTAWEDAVVDTTRRRDLMIIEASRTLTTAEQDELDALDLEISGGLLGGGTPSTYVQGAVADTLSTHDDYLIALGDYTTDEPGLQSVLTAMQDRIDNEPDGYQARIDYLDVTTRADFADRIAIATAAYDDLLSDYRHVLGFVSNAEANLALAAAYKESLREDYEQWMDEYWKAHLEELANALAEAEETCAAYYEDDFATDHAAWVIAIEAFGEAEQLIEDIDKEIATLESTITTIEKILTAYIDAEEYNVAVIDALKRQVYFAELNVEEAEDILMLLENGYDNDGYGDDDGDEDTPADISLALINSQVEELTALLAEQAVQVDYWKALLDEAIENAS